MNTARKAFPTWPIVGVLTALLLTWLVLMGAANCRGAGCSYDDQFVVFTPGDGDATLAEVQRFRRDFEQQWLGCPASGHRTAIYITFSDTEDSGVTWAKDHPDRVFNNIYLTTTRERAVGSTLHHELVHATLATAFPHPNRLPSWIEEGIATRFDDDGRKADRELVYAEWNRTGYPRLASVLCLEIQATHETAYAVSSSLVDYMITIGDKQTVVRCGALCRANTEKAFAECYGLTLEELQRGWEAFMGSRI